MQGASLEAAKYEAAKADTPETLEFAVTNSCNINISIPMLWTFRHHLNLTSKKHHLALAIHHKSIWGLVWILFGPGVLNVQNHQQNWKIFSKNLSQMIYSKFRDTPKSSWLSRFVKCHDLENANLFQSSSTTFQNLHLASRMVGSKCDSIHVENDTYATSIGWIL